MPSRTSKMDFNLSDALFGDVAAFGNEEHDREPKRQKLNHSDEGEESIQEIDAVGTDEIGFDLDDESFIQSATTSSNRKASNLHGKTVKKGGGFQAMGLNSLLLKAITRKGFSVPTPIQRKVVPLVIEGRDVVGMARTGSGKTGAFVIPLIQKLKTHSVQVGARAVIMSPSRELALQTLKVVKELGKGTNLRTVLLVGGDSLEEQFTAMTSNNPDVIIATPGRFLHLMVEMKLDLSSMQYVVFDEADRLFEMGFAEQLSEILAALPTSRQTLLFSATLPSSLVEFARAGLQEPKLVRLDAESKVSPDLQSAFLTIKSAEKEGALIHILEDIIKMPVGPTDASRELLDHGRSSTREVKTKKRKQGQHDIEDTDRTESPTPHSTIIFTATKHHVEYIATLLTALGYSVSYIYGSLDQTARKQNVQNFRSGLTNILVVTDVAARGIDVPILANVINYDFPPQPKIYVHRVGRTARAGKTGWSYSLVRDADLPYLLDLQLFLGRRFVLGRTDDHASFAEDVVVGSLPRNALASSCERIAKWIDEDDDIQNLKTVAIKGEKLYNRTRSAASTQSARRSKSIVSSSSWGELSKLFADESVEADEMEIARENMLRRVGGFRPAETVFEIGKRGKVDATVEAIKVNRQRNEQKKSRLSDRQSERAIEETPDTTEDQVTHRPRPSTDADDVDSEVSFGSERDLLDAEASDLEDDDEELEVVVSQPNPVKANTRSSTGRESAFQDTEHFMSYLPSATDFAADRAYGVASGSNEKAGTASFLTAARNASMNLAQDEASGFAEPSKMRWDKRSKKYVARANDEDGSKGKRMIRSESGMKIAASLRSGRFDAWRKANNISRVARVGDREQSGSSGNTAAGGGGGGGGTGKRYKHKAEKAPKEADKFRDDYHKRKKKVAEAKEKRIGKFKEGAGRSELRSAQDVKKMRREKDRRRAKNARPSRKR